jgi:hypothetical protein
MAGQLTISTLNDDTGVLATQNGMRGIAKAWVNYNGSGAAIRNSFNVSSITVNGAGDYTVNFTTAMANANYAVACICTDDSAANRGINLQGTSSNMTTSGFRTNIFANANPSTYCAIVMGS